MRIAPLNLQPYSWQSSSYDGHVIGKAGCLLSFFLTTFRASRMK